jgi:alcohol dehydrogenase class IV
VLEALPRALAALPRLLEAPADARDSNPSADRAAMSHAALLSGLALANSGLGLAHGVAAALGAAHCTPHGVACAAMLPVALRVNRPVATADFATLEHAIDPMASRDEATAADAFVDRMERLCQVAGAPMRLAELGVTAGDLDWLAEHSGGASMRGNPVQLAPVELRAVLAANL